MGKINVVILNSDVHTSTMPFDNLSSFIQFVGLFVDNHSGWDRHCDMILVHQNNQVIRYRFHGLHSLVDFARGIQVASWLSSDEDSIPSLNYLDWLGQDLFTVQYDSRLPDEVAEEDRFNEDPFS